MTRYGTIAAEIVEQSDSQPARSAYTHVFLQGGLGGLAAGLVGYLWEFHGEHRPRFVVVEPQQADCLDQGALAGQAARATGSVDSVMAGLACGETSPLAWRFLRPAVDDFMTISDDDAVSAMRILAAGSDTDVPIVAGELGVAGLTGLIVLLQDEQPAGEVGLDGSSCVLFVNTEGATAPATYWNWLASQPNPSSCAN